MKHFNKAKKFASNLNTKIAVGSLMLVASSGAHAAGPMDDIWAAIDLSGIATKIGAAGVLIIGITMALKSIGLGKRTVNKI